MIEVRIDVMYDSRLTSGETSAVMDGISEIRTVLEENGLADAIKFRLYGKSEFYQDGKRYSLDDYLRVVKSYPARRSIGGRRERLIDIDDLVDLVSNRNPYVKDRELTVLFISCPISTINEQGILRRRYAYSENSILAFSTFPYRVGGLSSSDEYRVIKMILARELGKVLGALKHRREKVAWRYGTVACVGALCALNRADSIIQRISLAQRLDLTHVVYCPYCLHYIKRYYHPSTDTTQP